MRIVTAVAMSVVLVACGGDDDPAVQAPSTTTTTEAASGTTTTEAATSTEVDALEVYVADVLRWADGEVSGTAVEHQLEVSSPTHGVATVAMVGDDTAGFQIESLFTDSLPEDLSAAVKLGYPGENEVRLSFEDPALTPDLTLHYGEAFDEVLVVPGELGGAPVWSPGIDPALDTGPRRVTVMWRDADGVAVAGWVQTVPAGEFAAG